MLRNKVMQKIRDIQVEEIQNQPDHSSTAQSMGNESAISTCDPTTIKALIGVKDTFASIGATEDTPTSNYLSTATATTTAKSNHITPSPPKKRKTGREEHHVHEGRTLFHESHQGKLHL